MTIFWDIRGKILSLVTVISVYYSKMLRKSNLISLLKCDKIKLYEKVTFLARTGGSLL
jgi:hypothetical protein